MQRESGVSFFHISPNYIAHDRALTSTERSKAERREQRHRPLTEMTGEVGVVVSDEGGRDS